MTSPEHSEAVPTGGTASQAAVRLAHLSKTFPAQRALDDVSLEIRRGEIHALIGQNGSGKSTLIKCLSGFHKPDPGTEAWIDDEAVKLGSLSDEQQARMLFIHQDLALIPTLTVRENLGLGPTGRSALAPVDRAGERRRTRELLALFELEISPDTEVGKLTPFQRSAVAIVRALASVEDGAALLVLDEPTASMGAAEVDQLFATLRRVNEQGVAILYVSHFLPEVLRIADRISVLRDGARVATVEAKDSTEDSLVELIVGSKIDRVAPQAAVVGETPSLEVTKLTLPGLSNATFSVRPGEIVGITGLIGSGYELIPQCLAGSRPWDFGGVSVCGHQFRSLSPTRALEAGMATVPVDRHGLGLIAQFTLAENLTLPRIGAAWSRGRISRARERADVQQWLDRTGVVPPNPDHLVQDLSGGNQQKVMLAKALRLEPKVLVLAEPTQAVDVGASASIRRLITELAADDHAVLVTSSDPEELEQICHRVLVTRDGRIACELVGDQITEDRILFESQFEGATV